jgi:hypothetical protein
VPFQRSHEKFSIIIRREGKVAKRARVTQAVGQVVIDLR